MFMKILDVPTTNMSDLKKSPKKVIEEVKDQKTGVYVFNHDKPTAVILDVDDYEALINRYEEMEEKLADLELATKLPELKKETSRPASEVIGEKLLADINESDDDEWE